VSSKTGYAVLASVFTISSAHAQPVVADIMTEEGRFRAPGSDVMSRVAEEYQPVGGRVGSFFLYPQVDITAGATSNVLARPNNERSDVLFTTTASARFVRPSETDRIAISAQAGRTQHMRTSGENTTPLLARASWRLGAPDASRFDFNAVAARKYVARADINDQPDARSPVKYATFAADAGYTWVSNRVSLSAGGEIQRLNYVDAVPRGASALISQAFRDYTLFTGKAEVRYDMASDIALLSRGIFSRYEYDLDAGDPVFSLARDIDRDSNLYRVEAGIGFSRKDVIYGSITAGYSRRSFAQANNGALSSGGLSFAADVIWNPGPATTITLNADRAFLESASRVIAGFRTISVSGRIDQAVGRALVLSASSRFLSLEPIGNASTREEYQVAGEVNYFLTRRYRLIGIASYGSREPAANIDGFDEFKVRAGLRFTL
jgi:hypothetical protein